ncbi:NUDIX domain-containing protein [Photobacterium minamisatsumaniensis]|uniref:NUDIX domain-containing protein n=1 Tax=Photobacterium minamisatsumaniensis TaxID=2910233 RepID=UPI003D13F488
MAFHYLARGVIHTNGHVLLVRAIGDEITFLPGGHIEFAEPAKDALERELMEEASIVGKAERFIGAAENEWFEGDERQAEINLLFEVDTQLSNTEAVVSNEAHLEFFWVPCEDIEKWNLYPVALRSLVKQFSAVELALQPEPAFWGSGIATK